MPTGKECLAELTISQQDEFKIELIKQNGEDFFNKIMDFEKVNSIGSLLRILEWNLTDQGTEYWRKIFFYHITPEFARHEIKE